MFCSNCGARLREHAMFCGECSHPVKKTKKLQSLIDNQEPISGLRLNYVAYRKHFHFSLEEKGGIVLFSYEYLKKDCGFTEQENLSVDPSYMRELQEFVKENGYVHLIDYNPTKEEVFEADAPQCTLTLIWADNERLVINSRNLPPNGEKLKEFFISIAENTQ